MNNLLEVREGKNQVQILAAVAELQYGEEVKPRQKDITERVPITKGAVSSNCKKLVKAGLLDKDKGKYTLQESELMDIYKEHLESTLSRERKVTPFEEEIQAYNEVRTRTKKELAQLIRTEIIRNVLIESLIKSLKKTRIQTLREVLIRADEVVRILAQQIVTNDNLDTKISENIRALFMLAITLNNAHGEMSDISQHLGEIKNYFPGNVPEQKIINHLRGD